MEEFAPLPCPSLDTMLTGIDTMVNAVPGRGAAVYAGAANRVELDPVVGGWVGPGRLHRLELHDGPHLDRATPLENRTPLGQLRGRPAGTGNGAIPLRNCTGGIPLEFHPCNSQVRYL